MSADAVSQNSPAQGQPEYAERSACYLCGGHLDRSPGSRDHVVRIPDYESSLGEFDVVRCRRCRLGHTNPYPTPETAGVLYSSKMSADFDVITGSVVDRLKDRRARQLVRSIASELRAQRVLDFATGNGRFALAAAAALPDAEVDAVDFQAAAPPALASQSRVRYQTIDSFASGSVDYDLIVLRHVLEHTHDPVDLVRMLGRRLTPDGVLYVEVPNLDSTCGRITGRRWPGFYVPRHIFHYTPASLGEIVHRAGLSCVPGRVEMPLMGNLLAISMHRRSGLAIKLAGVALHPLQFATERLTGSSTCITAVCRAPRA